MTEILTHGNYQIAKVGKGATAHLIESDARIVLCGAGLGRGARRMNSPVYRVRRASEVGEICTRCTKSAESN